MNEKLKNEVDLLPQQAENIIIKDNIQYESASEFLKTIKGLRKKVNDSYDPIIKKAHEAHKEAIKQKKVHTNPIDKAEKIIKDTIANYLKECERKRIEEQLRLEEEEKKRQEDLAIKEAENAETKEEAFKIIEDAIENKPVIIAPQIESKIDGISKVKVWKWDLVDVNKVSGQFKIVDEKNINNLVKTMGKVAETIVGGIRVYQDTSIRVRS